MHAHEKSLKSRLDKPGLSVRSRMGLCLGGVAAVLAVQGALAQTAAQQASQPTPTRKFVLLLSDDPLLRRASIAVREGVQVVMRGQADRVELKECPYRGQDQVVAAYAQCTDGTVDWVIGPIGRSDASALASALASELASKRRPTLMLAPLPYTPPRLVYTLAADLESTAEAIARHAAEDACKLPLLLEAGGASATRVSVAVTTWWRSHSSLELRSQALPPRSAWAQSSEAWRAQAHDCLIFAGPGTILAELHPYVRSMRIYVTPITYEQHLDRSIDWNGIRIADATMLIEPEEWAPLAPTGQIVGSPILQRFYALGVDAAILVQAAQGNRLPNDLNGAIGRLSLMDGQYRRYPPIGEFRKRRLVRVSR